MDSVDVSFVIPCYNSGKTIRIVVAEILAAINKLRSYEIILVNDGSKDNTLQVIRDLCENYSGVVKGIHLTRNFGQESAIMAGFNHCKGAIVVCLDDDGQSPVDQVEKMLEKIDEGYDLVYADYYEKKETPFRLVGSKLNEIMMINLLNKPKEIAVNSFFACSRVVADEVIKYKGAYPYLPGLTLRSTKNIANIKVEHRERSEGKSGYTIKKLISLWINGFTSFSVKPLRAATFIGAFFAVVGFVFMLVAIIRKISGGNVQLGWTSLISLITFFDGIILVILGLVGEYVGRLYLCINETPQYVIKETIGMDE